MVYRRQEGDQDRGVHDCGIKKDDASQVSKDLAMCYGGEGAALKPKDKYRRARARHEKQGQNTANNKQMDAAGSKQPLAFGTLPLDIKELLY